MDVILQLFWMNIFLFVITAVIIYFQIERINKLEEMIEKIDRRQ